MESSTRLILLGIGSLWIVSQILTRSEACDTLPSTLHIIKEIYAHGGVLDRTCEGEVAVSKCEGSCSSRVKPSVHSHSGFLKADVDALNLGEQNIPSEMPNQVNNPNEAQCIVRISDGANSASIYEFDAVSDNYLLQCLA